jgi:hypothetical protein
MIVGVLATDLVPELSREFHDFSLIQYLTLDLSKLPDGNEFGG